MRDFYMRGNHRTLEKLAFVGSDYSPEQLDVLQRCLRFCLTHQYVFSRDLGTLYCVFEGSGMGTKVSGSLADKALYEIAEKPCAVNPF